MNYSRFYLLFIYLIFVFKNISAQSCPSTNSTWRPTMVTSNVVTSPSITTIQPQLDFLFGKSNLVFMGQYGYSANSISDGPTGVANSFTMNYDTWGPAMHWLVVKTPVPALKANQNYIFSYSFKLGQVLGSYNKIASVSINFFNPADITDPNGGSQYFTTPGHPAIYNKTVTTGSWSSSTTFVLNTITLTPTVDIGLSIMAIQITRTSQTGPSITTMFISNMKLSIASRTVPASPSNLISKDSELITIPKPPSSLDAQDLTTCPYLATDLVHWHDPTIWSGGLVPLPTTSSNIVIPAGKKVLISPCSINQTGIYQKITIPPTSELIFADANFTMNIQDIYVQGKFIMGTNKCRYNANINIIFNGAMTTVDTIAQYFGSKGIAVASGGFISVHGRQYHNTWTKLAFTAWSGDNVIYIQDDVNWVVGQQVVIATSVYEDEKYPENEVMTIAAIQGKVIQFTESLKYYHYGGQEYQAEVALLSRNIVFQGDSSSVSTSFGGHVLVSGEGQLAGIQLVRMGQRNIKGRYPLHFHLAKNVTKSYISDCSVVNSFYRCYTIHGTNNLTVTRNVAFDVTGHCYYLEDGVEMDNTISFNFASFVHTIGTPAAGFTQYGQDFTQSSSLAQPADVAAGGFYITNAWNSFIGNAASGGWAGFSFPNLNSPIGNSINVAIIPKQFTTKVFEGNTAHSSGYYFDFGSSIYVGGDLSTGSDGLLVYNSGRISRETYLNGVQSGGEIWMRFNNTKVFLSNRGIGMWGERVEVVLLESHDSIRPGSLFGEAWLSDAIVNGQTNSLLSKTTDYSRQGFQFYDTYVKTILTNIIFRNFIHNPLSTSPEDDNRVIISMTHSDEFKPQFISSTKNITIQGTTVSQYIGHRIIETGSSRQFNFVDYDGTISGRSVPTIFGAHDKWWQFDNTCTYNNDWNCWVCNKGSYEVASVSVEVPGFMDRSGEYDATSYVGYIYLFGNGITDSRRMNVTRNVGITGISDMGWYLYWSIGTPNYIKLWLSEVPYGHYVFFAIPYPASTTFRVSCEYKYNSQYSYNFTQAASAAAVRSGDGKKYYFNGTHLFVKVINFVLNGNEFFSRGGCKINDVYWEFIVHITATNTIKPPVNGYFTGLTDVLPSSTL
ncbi:hypothetical protein RB653_008572 [Dictyostelium firmibasis]|uniref:G8 domain-containing protein n=1 Tax=Dictyostelium firmibasis TaxID=79012 RepID=A0AAN7TRA4_9MYCE